MFRIIINIAGMTGGAICTGYLVVALATWESLTLGAQAFGGGLALVCLAVIGWSIAGIARAEL